MIKLRTWVVPGVLVALAGCEPTGNVEPFQFRLEQVQAYGTLDFDSTSAPPMARASGGSMLDAVAGVVQTEDGSVFVLDQSWFKVAVFSRTGDLQRVLPLNRGEGPGEFRLPVHMIEVSGDRLAVLDYGESRVILIDMLSGEPLRTMSLGMGNPLRLIGTSGQIWVLRAVSAGSESSRGIVVDLEGNRVGELPPLSAEDRPFGSQLSAATDYEGHVLISSRIPGIWYEWNDLLAEPRGSALVEGLQPPRVVQEPGMTTVGMARATPAGIAVVDEDRVLVRYWTTELDEAESFPVPGTQRHFLALFDRTGHLLAEFEISDTEGLDLRFTYGSPRTGHIFLQYSEPFPQVREFRIEEVR